MSKYRVQLRWIVEQELADKHVPASEVNWHLAYDKLGLADYPIFDEAYRTTINDKLIRHYYMYEIGAETVAQFRLFMRDTMHLIMPYYNQMYESLAVARGIDPLIGQKVTTTEAASGKTASNASSSATSTNDAQDIFSDTPQSALNLDNIKGGKYATTADFTNATASDSGKSDAASNYANDLNRQQIGHDQPESELLLLWRKTFVNIDRDIVEDREVRDCFMTIW